MMYQKTYIALFWSMSFKSLLISVSSSINWEQHFPPQRIVIKSKLKNIQFQKKKKNFFFIKKKRISLPWGPATLFVNYSSVVQVLKTNKQVSSIHIFSWAIDVHATSF